MVASQDNCLSTVRRARLFAFLRSRELQAVLAVVQDFSGARIFRIGEKSIGHLSPFLFQVQVVE
jgi:hypothetical protein